MSNFQVNVANGLNAEQISRLADEFFAEIGGVAQAEHQMLVDSTQLLALGGLTFDEVYGPSVYYAKQENDYSVGRLFDVFNKDTLRYGKHVANVARRIDDTTVISKALTYAGSYKKSRVQFQINSELMTDSNGRKYYEVLKRNHFVTSNVYSPWSGYGKRNGAMRRHKLYVKDLVNQTFMFDGEIVALGLPSVFDQVINDIYATGVVGRYEQILNDMDLSFVEAVSDNQELLFLNVFKAIKPELGLEDVA